MSRGDDIAKRIGDRLKWLEENDNPVQITSGGMELPYFWHSGAYRAGSKIAITYVHYQGPIHLTFDEAEVYADYLDKGGTKSHRVLQGIH